MAGADPHISRNFGRIVLAGLDMGVQIGIIDGLAINGSMSYVTNGGFFDFSVLRNLKLRPARAC